MKRRKGKHVGCSVESRSGRLRLRFRWQGRQHARETKLADTPANRVELEKLAGIVAAMIRAGRDPLCLFEAEKRTTVPAVAEKTTVREYFADWITDKQPPLVRPAQACDYRRHMEQYVLPRLGDVAIAELSPRDILGVRAELLNDGLSVKYVKNILGASFKAMVRDAREIDRVLERDPFVGVRWPRVEVPGPDPLTPTERSRILRWFEVRRFSFHAGSGSSASVRRRPHPHYHAYLQLLFWTGMRPSEASGLHWDDIDLEARTLRVARSRHMYEERAPKTASAARTVELLPETVRLLRAIQPLRVEPGSHVFLSTDGKPIEPKSLSAHWYACLRALGIRIRGIYSAKDTYMSTALTAGVNTAWLEQQTGVAYATIRKHYGRWLRTEGESQTQKIAAFAGQLVPSFVPSSDEVSENADESERWKCEEGDLNPHGCYPTSPSN